MNNNDINEIELVIENLIIYLKDKNLILSGEVSNFLNAISYLIDNVHNKSELEDNLNKLKQGTFALKKQLKDQKKKIIAIGKTYNETDLVIKFILLDCIRKRLIVLSGDLEYLSNGYSSMVDGYMSNHKDIIPNITRRFNSTNLHFYYNRRLKENYKKLKQEYFNCKLEPEDNGAIFSTWSYTAQEHVKTIFIENEKNNSWKVGKFIAMNFWFLERPLAFSVVNHELSHIIYMQENHKYKIVSKKNHFLNKIIKDIELSAFSAKGNSKITKNLITAIYQEIHCDLAAYSLDGVGYFYALFFTVMLGDISNFFFEDNEEISMLKEKFLTIDDYKCLKENIQCREWIKKSTNISIYVRLKILLHLIKDSDEYKKYLNYAKDSIKDNPYFEYKLINGIDEIISLIYCDKEFKTNDIPTMLYILKNSQKALVSYRDVADYTQLIYRLFKISFIDTKQKKLQFKIKNISRDNEDNIRKIIKWRESDLDNKNIKKISKNKTIDTLLWRYRILSLLTKGKKEFVNRSSRRFAMQSTLQLKIDEDIVPEEATYELISFNFQGKGFTDDVKKNITSIFEESSEDYKIFYNFDIYEISVLVKLTRIEIDDVLTKLNDTHMRTRYVLFKLEKDKQQSKNSNHIATVFVKVKNREENCKKFLEDYQNIKNNNNLTMMIYKSMGSEDFIVMIYDDSFDALHDTVDKFKKLNYLQSLEYVYGTNDIAQVTHCEDFKLRVYIKYKAIKTSYAELEDKSNPKNYIRVALSNYFHEYIETDNIGDIKKILNTIEGNMIEAKFGIVKYN